MLVSRSDYIVACLFNSCVTIKTTDKGPVFFTHRRVGKDGKPLNIYKFRSMVTNAEDLIKQFTPEQKAEYERNFKLEDDPESQRSANS